MFADDVEEAVEKSKDKRVVALGGHLDHVDDDGFYRATLGESLGQRFKVTAVSGKGMFSSVCMCTDETGPLQAAGQQEGSSRQSVSSKKGDVVAIKIARANEQMRKAALKELGHLQTIAEADPTGKHHVVRLFGWFDHRSHLCLALEAMELNLRQVIDKFGRGIGLSIQGVRVFGRQLLAAARMLEKLSIIHADIKPQNILADSKFVAVRLCDFGSAFHVADPENQPAPFLVSRYYRAPELMLGFKPSLAVDMWSLACVLFECCTGDVMFPGRDNAEMLHLILRTKGRFANKVVRRHRAAVEALGIECHFDSQMRFLQPPASGPSDPSRRRAVLIHAAAPEADIARRLKAKIKPPSTPASERTPEQRAALAAERQAVANLADLLERMTAIDPAKRCSPREALSHPFFQSQGQPQQQQQQQQAGKAAAGGGK